MRRFLSAVIILSVAGLTLAAASAQSQPELGDPPVASLISISVPDEDGIVTITGAAGAVFPNALVAVRNLYTEEITYVQAGITGSFSARLTGSGNTPYWVSPAASIPLEERYQPGALPGGPGTIVYGAFPVAQQAASSVTQIVIDGALDDWQAYPQAAASDNITSLRNQDSLYLAVSGGIPDTYALVRLTFTLDGTTYALSFNPHILQTATLRRVSPNEIDLGTLAVSAIQVDGVIEARVPLANIDSTINTATLNRVQFMDGTGAPLTDTLIDQPLPLIEELDGIVYSGAHLSSDDLIRFSVAGPLAQGASIWTARGRVDTLNHQPGSPVQMEMDVTMTVPDLPESLVGLRMIGQIGLQPVIGSDGVQAAGGLDSNNGWSSMMTPSGLAIDDLRGDFVLGQAVVEPQQVIRRGDQLLFGLQFSLTLPDDLPPGLYTPIFQGLAQVGDGEPFNWTDNGLFGSGAGISREPLVRLPAVFNVGGQDVSRLTWALFYDDPSDGSRGMLSEEDRAYVALSNRVRYDSPTYILPPSTYPIEPYLLNQMPGVYDTTAAPLIPLLAPGGRLSAQIVLPDGTVDDLGSASFAQSWLSTQTVDGQTLFSENSPFGVYRLTTLMSSFTDYPFEQYGSYQIKLSGSTEDVWGNRYEGGGTYTVLIAEQLDMTPGVLSGTPFEVGDMLNSGLRIAPGVPADVTITVQIYPLDGGPVIEQVFSGQANAYGYFHADDGFQFDVPGEYIIDYDARYTTPDGRLWAGSLRSAGVIANPASQLVVHGRRGLDRYYPELRQTWFNTDQYPPDGTAVAPVVNFPYQSGDVAWIADSAADGVRPVIQVQDTGGAYQDWLLGTLPGYDSPTGRTMAQLAGEDSLPLLSVLGGPESPYSPVLIPDLMVNQAYAYVSAVRPGVTLRQFVQGSDDESLLTAWNPDDPYNGQIGAGASGDQPGDFAFLFGGAVVRNAEAGIQDTAIYAALAVTTQANDSTRVYPPYLGETGGSNGGPLFTVRGEAVEMFFHPTGIQPGQVLTVGDTLSIAGQVAPTLASDVSVTITSPSGVERSFDGIANTIGYFYSPDNDFAVNEVGVWQVEITVMHKGVTSAGYVTEPYPTGGILGAVQGTFPVYVIPPDAAPLAWSQGGNVDKATPAGSVINFQLTAPDTWTDVKAYQTITMPGYILDNGSIQVFGINASYQYNPSQINRNFPNLEVDGRTSGSAASDVVTITFVMTGQDENGTFQAQSRMFTVLHDRLVSLETEPATDAAAAG